MIVVGGLAVRGGKVLMGRRPEGKMCPGMWEYPGGKVDQGETQHMALIREWWEEVGVTVAVGAWVGRCSFVADVRIEWDLYHVHFAWDAAPQNRVHTELRWVHPELAVKTLACTPTTYLVHQAVMTFLENAVLPATPGGE